MAIYKEIKITVNGNSANIDKPIYLYLGDGDITLYITISESATRIGEYKKNSLIDEFKASYARICLRKPNKQEIVTVGCTIVGDTDAKAIKFTITKELMDQISEAGVYDLQIHLYDNDPIYSFANRFTIPPVSFNVNKPLCDEGYESIVIATADASHANAATIGVSDDTELPAFTVDNHNVTYNKTEWHSGDLITSALLNKIETAIYANREYLHITVKDLDELSELETLVLEPGMLVYVKNEDAYYRYSDTGVIWKKVLDCDTPSSGGTTTVNGVQSNTITRIEIVEELPTTEVSGVLYIVIPK